MAISFGNWTRGQEKRLKLLESEFEKGELFSGNERELNNLRNKKEFFLYQKKVVELKAV